MNIVIQSISPLSWKTDLLREEKGVEYSKGWQKDYMRLKNMCFTRNLIAHIKAIHHTN